jgi:hypothetical protein
VRDKARANIAALRMLRTLHDDDRPATAEEQQVLARWAGWGALAETLFGDNPKHALTYQSERAELVQRVVSS